MAEFSKSFADVNHTDTVSGFRSSNAACSAYSESDLDTETTFFAFYNELENAASL
jgi:hypothetical protein